MNDANVDGGDDSSDADSESPERESARSDELERDLADRYEELEESYDRAREALEEYNRRAIDFVREHPGICIAGALGAGYIVGRLASRRWLR